MKAMTFLIRLDEPLLATQAQSGEANSAVSYPFIPGSMVRGALIKEFLGKHNLTSLDNSDNTTRQLFFDGTVCYLNAYLAHPNDDSLRLLPRPFSWFVPKDKANDKTEKIRDFAIVPAQNMDSPPKAPGAGQFVSPSQNEVQLASPALQMTVHNASDDRSRKQEGRSQVYRYDALAAGQFFVGTIISENGSLLQNNIEPLFEKMILNLGGSYTAGYGRVEISNIDFQATWQEYNSDGDPDLVTVTCLSDVILRGASGEVGQGLAALLGMKPERTFARMRVVGGFNRTWGLPLTQQWAIQAGSVFVFPASAKTTLETFVGSGLGERRAEGFGQVAINWHTQAEYPQSEMPARVIEITPPKALSQTSRNLAQKMVLRQLQRQVDRAIVKKINTLCKTVQVGPPSATQLSRARLAARRAWLSTQSDSLTEITKYFDGLSDLSKREWENSYIVDGNRGQKLHEWICDLARNPETCNQGYFGLETLPQVATETAKLPPVQAKAVAQLIEGVLGRAVKQAKKAREGGQYE